MRLSSFLMVPALLLLAACGGGGGSSSDTGGGGGGGGTASLRMNQTTVFVNAGASTTFSATVTGVSNTAVNWSVLEGGAGGSITAAGVYTAPALGGTFHIAAQSQADPAAKGLATVLVASGSTTYAGTFTSVGPSRALRYRHNSSLMPDGRVLIVGGTTTTTWVPLASSEWFNPATNAFTDGPTFATPRMNQAHVLLPDGRLLVIGGSQADAAGGLAYASAELYDPVAGTVTAAGTMATPRGLHSATLLADGRVLVAGGYHQTVLASAEVWNPRTMTFSAVGPMSNPRIYHTATLLADGRVMVVGGRTNNLDTASVEVFDPATNAFSPLATMAGSRSSHAAQLLPDGRVLVIGGNTGSGNTNSLLAISPSGTMTAVGTLQNAQSGGSLALLHSGKAMLAGGGNAGYTPPELIDLTTFATITTAPLSEPRSYVQGHALRNGKVFWGVGIGAGTSATNHGDLFQ